MMLIPNPHTARIRVLDPIPRKKPGLPFIQKLTLVRNRHTIGRLIWYAPDTNDGVMQILDIRVEPAYQRQNHGSALLRAAYEQAFALFKKLGIRPRRVWVAVEQKAHVQARAFLSRHGFHHVSSVKNVFQDQESLIYLKAFD